jgi:hypothetical protein
MKKVSLRCVFLTSVFVILALAACGPSQLPPTATPTPGIVVEGAVLDIAIIGDATMVSVGPLYAALVEEDLGVPVKVHERTTMGGMAVGTMLELLRTSQSWQSAIAETEIVVFWGNPTRSESTAHPRDASCMSRPYYVKECSPQSWDVFKEHVDGVIEEILALRGGKPTVIIAADFYSPFLSEWKEAGVEEQCTRCWEYQNEAIRQSAEEHGILFVSRHDAYNGPNHDQDPTEKGYIGIDGLLPSEAGQQFFAELLLAAGYWSATR